MKKLVIVGVTLSGNMGGQAMLIATMDAMRKRIPGCRFFLLSIYPEADARMNRIDDLAIIPVPAFKLVGMYLPLSFLVRPFLKLSLTKRILSSIAYFRALIEADLVIDLCGIAFVDGRGIPLLVYNMACFLPSILFGKGVVKLSQALGPFSNALNRLAAKLTLPRCKKVVVRGRESEKNVKSIGLVNTIMLPDVAFALGMPDPVVREAKSILRSVHDDKRPVIISPSRVVQKQCAKAGIDFIQEMSVLIGRLMASGVPVVLIAHSLAEGASKNNDVALCHEIVNSTEGGRNVTVIDTVSDARMLRALIGEAEIFIGCRFHSIVAALAMHTPCMVIGWSHKYREMLEPFGMTEWAIDASAFSSGTLEKSIVNMRSRELEIRNRIEKALPDVQKKAVMNFDIAAEFLIE